MKKKQSFDNPEIQKVIEEIVNKNKLKYSFTGVGQEDIAQEIRLKCWQLLEKYDPSRGQSIAAYLSVCCINALKNYKRDKFIRWLSPCIRNTCPLFDKAAKTCLIGYTPCLPYKNYVDRMSQKLIVRSPVSYDDVAFLEGLPEKGTSGQQVEENTLERKVASYVKATGDTQLFTAYKTMLGGNKELVEPKMRKRVRVAVSQALEEIKEQQGDE